MTPPAQRALAWRGAVLLSAVAALSWGGRQWLLRPVVLEVDGRARQEWVLAGRVADALRQARVALGPHDEVLPAAGTWVRPGMTIRVLRAFPVEVFSDGQRRVVRLARGSVAEALGRAGVRVGPLDRVEPELEQPVQPNMQVRVVRVREEVRVWRETVPFRTLRRPEPRWEQGRTGILREGRPGIVEHTELVRYENGRVVARRPVASRVVAQKVDRIVGVGTRVVWYTLETPVGKLRYRRRLEMVATAYYPGPESTGKSADGITATGMRAGHGVVAVDPRVIPLGTRLYIPGYGLAVAGDVGGAIKGLRIDLGFSTLREALHFGRRRVTVYVLD
ncbi:MAG TPA: ubiquitin-like domain-containing protein [Limnochordales bacterium]